MKSVLFVDDEPRILDGLRRMLHGQRRVWDMGFATSGDEALRAMATQPFDVVVSDMRMPAMDGAVLLGEVQRLYPRTVRIVLSGHADLEASMRSVRVSHQYLTKPCDADFLKEVVERACGLESVLGDRVLRETLGEVGPGRTRGRSRSSRGDRRAGLGDRSEGPSPRELQFLRCSQGDQQPATGDVLPRSQYDS